jgi:hypothetical protein
VRRTPDHWSAHLFESSCKVGDRPASLSMLGNPNQLPPRSSEIQRQPEKLGYFSLSFPDRADIL